MTVELESLAGGDSLTQEHGADSVVAVIRGRLRLTMERAPAPIWLRASDAVAIPAGIAYTLDAMQDSDLMVYPEYGERPLWGV